MASKSGMVNVDSVRTGISEAKSSISSDPFFQTGAFINTTGGGSILPMVIGAILFFVWIFKR